jgi:hypothetical protein
VEKDSLMVLLKYKPPKKKSDEEEDYISSKSVFAMNGGENSQIPPIEIQDRELARGHNIYVHNNKIKSRYGYQTFGNGLPLPSAIVQFEQFYGYDGTEYLVCFTETDAYQYNSSTGYWDLKTPNALIDDCETAWTASANVTATRDTTWLRYGTYSAKLAIAAAFTTGLAGYFNFSSKDLTGYTHLHAYIKSSVATTAGQIQILLDDTNGCVSPLETLDVPALEAGVAKEIEIVFADASKLGAILSVGISIATDIGAQNVQIDDIRAVKCFTGDYLSRFTTDTIYDNDAGELKFVASNGTDNPIKWNGTGNWADLGGTPNKAKIVKNFNHHLLLINCVVTGSAAPQRIDWADLGRPEVWSGEAAGSNSLAATSDFIIGADFLSSQMAILKESSISLMTYVGGTDPFEFEENKIKSIGCSARGSVQSMGSTIIFLGWDDVYEFDGYTCKGIGENVRTRLIDSINPAKLAAIHSHIVEELGIYILFTPVVGNDYCNTAWVYDYQNGVWYGDWEFADDITCTGFYQSVSPMKISEALMTLGLANFRISSRALDSLSPFGLLGDKNGYIYKFDMSILSDNGSAIDAYLDTKSYVLTEVDEFDAIEEIIMYAKGTSLLVHMSDNDGSTWKPKGAITLDATGTTTFLRNIKHVAEKHMIRFRNLTLNGWFEITGWVLKYIDKNRKPS